MHAADASAPGKSARKLRRFKVWAFDIGSLAGTAFRGRGIEVRLGRADGLLSPGVEGQLRLEVETKYELTDAATGIIRSRSILVGSRHATEGRRP
ncbi:MAG: hypothetical protein QOK48_2527 [Blastocatellia bacterium]|nr:hypothetical protein [Blastocatellia bacterium]